MILKLREQALDVAQNLNCTRVYFKKLTGVDFNKFENFAHGLTTPQPDTLQRYKEAVRVIQQEWRGHFSALQVFERFYIENMNTHEIAISLNVAEHIVVRCMKHNPKIRKIVLERKGVKVA